jgi:hypothetical protein
LSRFALVALLATTLLTACVDFADPVIPDRRASAILNANVRVFDAGVIQVDGSLSPGRDSLGFQRPVLSPFILVNDLLVQPIAITQTGVRTYSTTFPTPRNATAGPFTMVWPVVEDVGELPTVQWHGLIKRTADTLRITRMEDLVLRMDTVAAPSNPANRFRQWFIDIRAGASSFRVSGDGPVPLSLRIPAEWIPVSPDNRATVSLIYFQTAQLRTPPGTYLGNITLDTRLNWVVLFQTAP